MLDRASRARDVRGGEGITLDDVTCVTGGRTCRMRLVSGIWDTAVGKGGARRVTARRVRMFVVDLPLCCTTREEVGGGLVLFGGFLGGAGTLAVWMGEDGGFGIHSGLDVLGK